MDHPKGIAIIYLVLAAFFFFSAPFNPAGAEETFSYFDQDDELFEEDHTIYPSENSDDNGRSLFRDWVFRLSHEFLQGVDGNNRQTSVNRSSLVCKTDRVLSDIFLFRFDGKASLLYKNDHRAEDGKEDTNTEIKEIFFQAGFEKLTLRVGRQVVAWGETDGDVINDVISPRNEAESLFTELEDARLGQYMISGDFYPSAGNRIGTLFCFVTFCPAVNQLPERGTDFFTGPYKLSVSNKKANLSDREVGFRWKNTIKSFDLSVMGATLLQNRGVLYQRGIGEAERRNGRYNFYGTGAGYASGSLLFKLDLSFKEGISVQAADSVNGLLGKKTDLIDTAFAIDYNRNGSWLISIEGTNSHILKYSEKILRKENISGASFLLSKKILNEKVKIESILFHIFQEEANFLKADVEYSYSDNLRFNLQYHGIHINDRRSPLRPYRNKDRAGITTTWFF